MTFINVADLKPEGSTKSYRQINAEMVHQFPLDTLVNYEGTEYIGDDESGIEINRKLQLYIVGLNRDCDQTPLYTLSIHTRKEIEETKDFLHMLLPNHNEKAVGLISRLQGLITGVPEESISLVPESEYLIRKY